MTPLKYNHTIKVKDKMEININSTQKSKHCDWSYSARHFVTNACYFPLTNAEGSNENKYKQ